MCKRLLLISNSTNYGESYLEHAISEIQKFLGTGINSALFIPYAGVSISWDEYFLKAEAVIKNIGINLTSIHHYKNPLEAVKNAESIIVGGGNTFNLTYHIHKSGIVDTVIQKVSEGTPYIGWSAGAVVACPSMKTTNDMPIIEPMSFSCFNLVPFQINPHYTELTLPGHAGETREQRLLEFLEINKDVDVVGLRESSMLLIENKKVVLIGNKTLIHMRYKNLTREYNHEENLNFLMK